MRRFPENLLNALRAEECILFIGSGISQWSGLPSWEALLRRMLAYLDERALLESSEKAEIEALVQSGHLLTAASVCSSCMRKADLRDFVDAVFVNPNPRPHEIHRIIVELGPDSFITTNYDRLIEEAFQSAHGVALTVVNNDQRIEQAKIVRHGAGHFIFTPHGHVDNVDTIVLSHEDYRRIQYDSEAVIRTMEHLFLSRPVIYLGFGLRDPDFLMIKDRIAATYQGGEREHYAIMRDVSDLMKKHWRENYGINIISYPATQRSYDGLLVLLRELHGELKAPAHAVTAVAVEPLRPSYIPLMRSAMIRFCEDIVHSFADLQGQGVTVFASFRADLCRGDKIERISIHRRRPALLELLDSIPNLVVIGSPGSGKTYAMQTYAGILARRALEIWRSADGPDSAAIKHTIPLILPMKEYRGNIEEMIIGRVPRSIDARLALQSGLFVIIFDAINEVSQIHLRMLSRDIGLFLAKYPSNRFIFTSRAMHYVPASIMLPVFELQPVLPSDLEDYLKSKDIALEDVTESMQETLRNPLLLSMFVELRGRTAEVVNTAGLLDVYFGTVKHKFEAVSAARVSLMPMLTPIAYRLISEGSQSLDAPEIEREFRKVIAKQEDHQRVNPGDILKALISLGLLLPDAEGRVSFFHQTALEYVAAVELLSRYSKGSVSVRKLLELHRWDETIILFIALLPATERRRILQEISEIDIVFACHAFESATVKDGSIGLSLFDILRERLSEKLLPKAKRELLAEAAIGLAPYGRKEVLAKWLDDKNAEVAGSAAVFLGLMGAKEFVPKFVSKLRTATVWPSPFAKALDLLINESVVKALVKAGETSREELALDNFADVLNRFESGALYSEVKRLSRSRTPRKRQFAARILSKFESNRSVNILADMLEDSNADVRLEAIFGLEYSRAAAHKTDRIIASMFNLLWDRKSGKWAADYLLSVSNASIVLEAERRIGSPRNAHELINLCAILAKSEPNKARKLLFDKLDHYKPSFHDSLANALEKLPIDRLLPDILSYLRSENRSLRSTVLDTLDWLRGPGEEQLPISKKDCEYLVRLWERLSVQDREITPLLFLLGDAFQSIAKPLLLRRLSNPRYKLRVQLLPIISRMPLTQGDLSPAVIEWLIGKFGIELDPYEWPPGQVVGMVAEESMVTKKLIPLLSSPDPTVRNNAYCAIRVAEGRLEKRLLRE